MTTPQIQPTPRTPGRTFAFLHRTTRTVLWEGHAASLNDAFDQIRQRGPSLDGADLTNWVLKGHDLSRLSLRGADLDEVNAIGADFSGSDLSGARLTDAQLNRARFTGANLTGTTFFGAALNGAELSGVTGIPVIGNIHRRVYEAAQPDGALDQSTWHTREGVHCHAGWLIHLAGPAGYALERLNGGEAAASLIYLASDPARFAGREGRSLPMFHFVTRDDVLATLTRLAVHRAGALAMHGTQETGVHGGTPPKAHTRGGWI